MNYLKTIIIIIAVVSVIFCLTLSITANVFPSYDENELFSILESSFDFYTEFFLIAKEEMINHSDTPIIVEREDGAIWPSNTYYPRTDELGNWESFCNKLYSYYTDEIGDIFIDNMQGFENSGKVYVKESMFYGAQNDGPFFSYHDTIGEYDIDLESRDTFKLIESNGNTLIYEYQVFDFWIGVFDISDESDRPSPEDQVLNLTVEFTHTESGWRISGGSMVDTYLYGRSYDYYLNGAPQTGFATVAYAAVAVVSAATAVTVAKKRRK